MRSRNTEADGARPGASGSLGRRPGGARSRRAGWRVVLAAVAAAGTLALSSPASAQSEDDLPPELAERTERHMGFPAVPASTLSGTRLAGVRAVGPRLEATLDDEPVSATAGSPFVRLGDRVRQLPNAPYLRDGRLWVPVRLLATAGLASDAAGRTAAGPASDAASAGARSGSDDEGPWRVVLDPGHGGRDPGARGPGGTREKTVVLQITRKIRDRLEEREGIEVSLTRDDDRFLPLEQRSQIAVEEEADLFLSIHANSARSSGVRGFETYFLGEARTEESRQVAMRENAAIQYQEDSEWSPEEQVEYILTSADQRLYAQESNYLAGHIQNRLRSRHPGSDRGVKQAGFYVLMGSTASMPSVLVEAGFLSNPASERFLAGAEGQAQVAESVADAVEAYFEERERRGGIQTASR